MQALRTVKLVTIVFSHYNERARWALDHHGVSYAEQRYMPGFHFYGVLRHARGRSGQADNVSSKYSTPVLVGPDGEVVFDSGKIVAWAEARADANTLYPPAHRRAIEAFEQHMHDRLGPHIRRYVYAQALDHPTLLPNLASRNVGSIQARMFRIFKGVPLLIIRRSLDVNEAAATRSLKIVREVMDEVAERLADKRRYLFADQFTAADLTFPALAAPSVMPPKFGAHLPALDELPDEARQMVAEYRDHAAGRHVLRMFAQHRRSDRRRGP